MNFINTDVPMKNICCMCLSDDRKLLSLYKITDAINLFYSTFDDEDLKEAFYRDVPSLYMCWECRALVRRTQQFRIQAAKAFRQLTDVCEGRTNNKLKSLSNLSTHTITDSINIIHEEPDNFIDCSVEINSENDDEIPLSGLKLENSDIDNQNTDYDSNCDIFSNDISYDNIPKLKKRGISNKNNVSDLLLHDNSVTDNKNINDNSDCDNYNIGISDKTKKKTKKSKPNAVRNTVSNETISHNEKVVNALKCKLCGIEFEAKKYLDKHYLKCHKKRRRKKYPCRECELNFVDAKQRWRHVQKTHAEKHKCSVCTKSFSFKSNLLKHEKNHTSPTPREKCLICHKMVRFDLVKTHSLTHTDRQTYTCVSCDKRYVCKDTYDNHMKYSKAHAKVDLKRYKCPSCDKRYRYQSELRDHVNYQHKSQTEHKCHICEKGYATKRCVNRHIKRAHEGIKENTGENICQRCGKSFSERKRLLEHERIHSGSRPLSCELCGHTFRQRASLYTHKKRVHKLVKPNRVITVLEKNS